MYIEIFLERKIAPREQCRGGWQVWVRFQEHLFEEIATTGAERMGSMCPRDIAKLMYSLGRVQAGDREFATAARPHIMAHLDHFTYNVRACPAACVVLEHIPHTSAWPRTSAAR